ncbi:MAG TPA: NAD(P)-dependent alcohol dehydrogenase [Trebonia sp.]
MKIRAAVAWEAGATLSIEEFDLDEPRDDEILVRVEAAGVCHTDDSARLGRLPVVFPIILGHEGAGTVERTGRDVTRVRPGDRVLFTPDYCGRCEQCLLGYTPYCDQVVPLTFSGTRPDGSPRAHQNGQPVRAAFFGQSSFSTHSLVTERNVVPVAPDAPLSLLAGFTCGVQTGAGAILNAMPVGSRSRVAVWGAGAVGLAAVMAAKASGAAEIVALDQVARRLTLAAELGATVTIDTTGQDLADVAAAVVKAAGRGMDVALDTTGNPAVILAAVRSLAAHGTASVITSSGAPVTLPPGDLLLKGRQLRGTMNGHINPTVFIPRLLELHARGRFPVERLVRNYRFDELNAAIADSLSGATVKPVLTFG